MYITMTELSDYQNRQLARQRAGEYRKHKRGASIGSRVWSIGAQLFIVGVVVAAFGVLYLYFLVPLVKNLIHALSAL